MHSAAGVKMRGGVVCFPKYPQYSAFNFLILKQAIYRLGGKKWLTKQNSEKQGGLPLAQVFIFSPVFFEANFGELCKENIICCSKKRQPAYLDKRGLFLTSYI